MKISKISKKDIDWKNIKVGIANAGGSLKGVAFHTGFYKALYEYGIEPSIIIGTSAGSIVGQFISLYGLSKDTLDRLEKLVINLKPNDYVDKLSLFSLAWCLMKQGRDLGGYIKGKKLEEFLEETNGKSSFNQTKIKFGAHVINLSRRRQEILTEGELAKCARASASIPLVFEPTKINNEYYLDGGVFGYHAADKLLNMEPELDAIIVVDFHLNNEEPSDFIDEKWLPAKIIQRCLDAQAHEFEKLKFEIIEKEDKDIYFINVRPYIPISIDLIKPKKKTLQEIINKSYQESIKFLEEIRI